MDRIAMNDAGYELWLDYRPVAEANRSRYAPLFRGVEIVGSSEIIDSIHAEFALALPRLFGKDCPLSRSPGTASTPPRLGFGLIVCRDETLSRLYGIDFEPRGDTARAEASPLADEGYRIVTLPGEGGTVCVTAKSDAGLLYGAFRFLRLIQTGEPIDGLDVFERPAIRYRMLNHWDNLDGSIERGYAGKTLWRWDELPSTVDPRYRDYARACASVGLNASVLNNVNTAPEILDRAYLVKVAAIASVLRRYGISTFLSVNFASPVALGRLATADPSDPAVIEWWKEKADEIYGLIPDFGGFLVKADSEGQPGPFAYGKNHADGANLLADALAPHGGIVVWRAFVYGHGEADRAKKAYANFKELDGGFRANAAVQVKNGAIDFQPREPAHPLFGGMEKTPVFMEFQIAQEYLGQGNHLVYLAPMWKEILDFDTHAHGTGSTVARIISSDSPNPSLSGIAAVTNTGNDPDWCGSLFHPANWYAYGRLAWDPSADTTAIAREWIECTWGSNPELSRAILGIMTGSWEACVDYMTPLGLHHIMKEGHHYGPDPGDESAPREDWRPTYYHRASRTGLGFDRTRAGTAAVDQYHGPVAEAFNDVRSCPEKYLLWFHHVPWDFVLSSGRTLKDELPFRYDRGVASAEAMRAAWASFSDRIPASGAIAGTTLTRSRHRAVLAKLDIQVADAHEWRSVCVPYFLSFAEYRSVFAEYGYPEAAIERRVKEAWDAVFEGDDRFYFDSGDGTGYMMDTGNDDARTEGMSYGMMMAVQMGRKDVFDRLWAWSKRNMFMTGGENAGYFAWSCKTDGTKNSNGPAPDGEEYYALALFFASRRWGDGAGIYAYSAEARDLLRTCLHRGEAGVGNPMWDPANRLIKFVPNCDYTDPSYHLPHFYDLFAEFAYPEDRPIWREAAAASRRYLPTACHPATGLAPEYSNYDGTPYASSGHGDYYSDSYRVGANLGLNALWTRGTPELTAIADRILAFFAPMAPDAYRKYRIDGTPLDEKALHPVGIVATNAMAAIAASPGNPNAEKAVRLFWNTPPRTGERRYYDNCLYLFAMLALSGRYRVR